MIRDIIIWVFGVGLLLVLLGTAIDMKPGGDGYGRGGMIPATFGALLMGIALIIFIGASLRVLWISF